MMIFTWLIFIVAAIWFGKYALDHNIFHINKLDHKNHAFEILKKSYARGEINKQGYEDKKRELKI